MRNRKKKAERMAIVIGALLTALIAKTAAAYFTDREEAVNTFTIGKVAVKIEEPGWEERKADDLIPGQSVRKDPQVRNDGINTEYVFVEVDIPCETVIPVRPDGSKGEAAYTALFSYAVNDVWHELSETQNTQTNTVTRLYVYGSEERCSELEAGETTPSLFEEIRFADIVEEEKLEGAVQEIVLRAYGIQAEGLLEEAVKPEEIWAVLTGQITADDLQEEDT